MELERAIHFGREVKRADIVIFDKEHLNEEYIIVELKKPKLFAIDFDEKCVRVARTMNLIAGDGKSNVLHLNTLDYERWDDNLCPKKDDYPIFFATMKKPSKDNSGDKIYVTEDYIDYHYFTYNDDGTFKKANIDTYTKSEFIKKYGNDIEKYSKYRKNDSNADIIDGNQYKVLKSQNAESVKDYKKYEWVEEYKKYLLDEHNHLIVDHDLYNHDGLTRDGIAEAFAEFAKKEKLSFF